MRPPRHGRSGRSRSVACVSALFVLVAGACTSTDQAVETPTGCVPDAELAGTQSRHRLTSGGNEYRYLLYVPASAPSNTPLVLNFHGLGGDGASQAAYTRYTDLAETEGFVTVHPSGLLVETNEWGATRNWEGIGEDNSGRDDVQFVSDLIDQVAAQGCIDPKRVYATGFSNGGYFSAQLVCRLADRIAATFSVGGISRPDGCQPSRPVAMGAIHGTADEVVPFDDSSTSVLLKGADIDDDKAQELDAFFAEIIPDEVAEFAAGFNCTTMAESMFDAVTTLTSYTDCDGDVALRFYAMEGAGHIWPGSHWDKGTGKYPAAEASGLDATADGWAFMSQYSLDE